MEEMLRLPRVVAMESPVAPKGEGQEQQHLRDWVKNHKVLFGLQTSKPTYFLAMNLASESASCMPFLMVSVKTATFLG